MKNIINALLDLLYPPRCPFCRKFIDGKEKLCADCAKSLPYLSDELQGRRLKNIDACYSALFYSDSVRDSIHRYKFGNTPAYADCYAELMADCAEQNNIECDIVTWAPLSRSRLRKRGYDQALLLAKPVAEHINVPCERLLAKTRNNPAQSGTKSVRERMRNVRGVYCYSGKVDIAGKTILLVDDIVTTGATLGECAEILRNAGAKRILALTLACTKD